MITFDMRKLQQRLESQPPSPLYVLAGDEPFLIEEAVKLIKGKAVDEGTIDFNFDSFYASETKASQVRDAVTTIPMMSPRRLVIYRGVDDLKDADWEILFDILESPVDSTTFVMTCESLDKRKKSYKRLSENAIWVDLKRPYDNQIPDWIDYLAYRKQVEISKEAAQTLKQFVGVNLTELSNELDKLRNFIGERKNIEVDDVLSIVSRARVDRIFDLTDAIGKNDRAAALASLANLLEHGQNEIGALAMIIRHIRILAKIKEGQREGLAGAKLCARAGIPQFLLGQYSEQSRSWSDKKLNATVEALHDADLGLKTTNLPPHVWLENFILKTC